MLRHLWTLPVLTRRRNAGVNISSPSKCSRQTVVISRCDPVRTTYQGDMGALPWISASAGLY